MPQGMKNVTMKKEGAILTIRVDLSATGEHSKSGKSTVIGTTGGNVELGDGVYVGLNVYKTIPKEQWTPEMVFAQFQAKLARKAAKATV